MKIEEAIRQGNFQSEYHKLSVNLMYTGSWLMSIQHQFFKSYDLSIQQYNILRILRGARNNPMSMQDISERMIDRMSNCSRLVEKLRLKGLLERKECVDDRRQVDIHITESGLKILRNIDENIDAVEQSLRSLSEQEAEQLNQLLDKLRG